MVFVKVFVGCVYCGTVTNQESLPKHVYLLWYTCFLDQWIFYSKLQLLSARCSGDTPETQR